MDEYIGKGALYDALWDAKEEKQVKSLKDVFDFIDKFSTADVVEVKHGEWVINDKEFLCGKLTNIPQCSNCKCVALCDPYGDYELSPYCPHCGAKMDSERKKGDERLCCCRKT